MDHNLRNIPSCQKIIEKKEILSEILICSKKQNPRNTTNQTEVINYVNYVSITTQTTLSHYILTWNGYYCPTITPQNPCADRCPATGTRHTWNKLSWNKLSWNKLSWNKLSWNKLSLHDVSWYFGEVKVKVPHCGENSRLVGIRHVSVVEEIFTKHVRHFTS